MATYSASTALAFSYNAANGTTGSFTPSGSNIAVLAMVSSIEFGSKTLSFCRYPNSSGTDLTRIGSDYSWNSTACLTALWEGVGVPASSTTLYAGWASSYLQSAIAGIAYSGVDQTTPFSGGVDNSGLVTSVTTTVASVTVTGCTAGQTIVAMVAANADNVTLSAFTAVSGTTLRASDVTGTYLGVAVLEKVATGSSETLSVNVNCGSSAILSWAARGIRVNDAAGGGGPTYTLTADGATYSYSGASAALPAGRILAADAGSYSYSGAAASLAYGRVMPASGGTYSYSGTAAGLLRGFNLAATGGTYSYSGQSASLVAGRVLPTSGATFAYAGQDAILSYTTASAYTLTADGGAFSYSGQSAAFLTGRVLAADGATFAYGGGDARLVYSGEASTSEVPGIDFGVSESSTKTPKWWAKSGQTDEPAAQEEPKPKRQPKKAAKAQEEAKRVIEAVAREQVARGDVPKSARFAEVRSQIKPLGPEAVSFNWPALYERLYAQALTDAIRQEMAAADQARLQQLMLQEEEALLLLLAEA